MAESIPQKKSLMLFGEGSENVEKEYSHEEKRLKSLVDGEGYAKWEKDNRLWEIQNLLVPIAEDWEKQYSYEEKRLKSLVDGEGYDKWEKDNRLWEIQNYLVPLAEEEKRGFSNVSTNREEKREKYAAEGRCLVGLYLTPYCKCDTQCCGLKKPLEEYPPEITPIWLAYRRQCRQSHYFDIDDYPGYRFGAAGVMPLAPSQDFNGKAKLLMKLANRAIQEYNEKECNIFKYKVLKIEKVNYTVAMYNTYWMTVKVLNLTLGTPIETFQIHAGICKIIDDEVIFCCRPKEEPIIGLPSCEFCFGLLPERCVTGGKEP